MGNILKFSELHVRMNNSGKFTYHYDYNDIVLKPATHVFFDSLYQGLKHRNW